MDQGRSYRWLLTLVLVCVTAVSCRSREEIPAGFVAKQNDLMRHCENGSGAMPTAGDDRAMAADVASMVSFARQHPDAITTGEGGPDDVITVRQELENTAWVMTCNRPSLVGLLIGAAKEIPGNGGYGWLEAMSPTEIAALSFSTHDMNRRCYARSDSYRSGAPLGEADRAAFERDARTITTIGVAHPAVWVRLGVRVQRHPGMPAPLRITFLDPVGATCRIADILATIERAAGVPPGTLSEGPTPPPLHTP